MAGDEGIEPSSSDLEADVLPLHQSPVAHPAGFEPATTALEARYSSTELRALCWHPVRDSNSRPSGSKPEILSAELTGRRTYVLRHRRLKLKCAVMELEAGTLLVELSHGLQAPRVLESNQRLRLGFHYATNRRD